VVVDPAQAPAYRYDAMNGADVNEPQRKRHPANRFYLVDVFAERPLAGNQLAVFIDDPPLTTDRMQALARELNFSETTFVRPHSADGKVFQARIFTPAREVPFAGHPVLGTAHVIQRELLRRPVDAISLNLKAGPVPVEFRYRGRVADILWMLQPKPSFGARLEREAVCAQTAIAPVDIDDRFPIEEVSTGFPFLILPMTSLAAIRRLELYGEPYARLIESLEAKAVLAFTRETYDAIDDLNVRVFAEHYGTREDAATGSANGALAAYLARHRWSGSATIDARVEQGYEIGRPSLLLIKAHDDGSAIEVRVGGRVQPVAEGRLSTERTVATSPPRRRAQTGATLKGTVHDHVA
jgi:trans-2,3-dihydro-3-hydroxyanthranilate isomerase